MKKIISHTILLACLFVSIKSIAQKMKTASATTITSKCIDQNLQDATKQYMYLITKLPDGVMPRSFTNDTLRTCTSENWVAGFYPGTLLYLYENTKENACIMKP